MKPRAVVVLVVCAAVASIAAECDPDTEIPPATVDTATELNAWMASHPVTDLDGRTVTLDDGAVQPPAGTTLSNGTLRRTIESLSHTAPHVHITASEVTLKDLTVAGVDIHDETAGQGSQPIYNPQLEGQHGILIEGDAVTVDTVGITNVRGDGIYIWKGAQDTTITDVFIQSVGRTIISNTHSYRTRVDRLHGQLAGLWLVNLEASAGGEEVVGARYSNLTTDWYRPVRSPYWLMAAGPDYSGKVRDTVIEWPTVVANGNRIGSLTLIDPCTEDLEIQ